MRVDGFTLVELIVTLVLVGIVAAYAAPRFFDRSGYVEKTTADQMVSILRLAQRMAMADQRRIITFSVTSNRYALLSNGLPLSAPGVGHFPIDVDPSIELSPATSVAFDQFGATTPVQITVRGGAVERICVESTGYAHAC